MATQALDTTRPKTLIDAKRRHELSLNVVLLASFGIVLAVAYYGFSYYRLPIAERPGSSLHVQLRPSGHVGLLLGKLALFQFLVIYLYAIRKRLAWLKRIGNSRHWLDYHVVLGIIVPVVVTFHASFKVHGIAGLAFWVMWAVTISGFVGRYFYSQIPRSLNAAELTLKEIEDLHATLSARLGQQHLFSSAEVAPLVRLPTRAQVGKMSAVAALARMIYFDLARPFRVSKLRRKSMSPLRVMASLGGLLPLGSPDLEEVISMIRKCSWLSTKITFLEKIHQVFNLWHVVHRPFSYSLVVLVVIHIGTELLLGYF